MPTCVAAITLRTKMTLGDDHDAKGNVVKTNTLKTICVCLMFWASFHSLAWADEQHHFDALPQSVEAFSALQNTANTPEIGAALFVVAMLVVEQDEVLGEQLMVQSLTDANLTGDQLDTSMRDHLKRLERDPDIARSYVSGAKPDNGYRAPDEVGFTFKFSRNRYSVRSEIEVRVFVATSGAGTPRPVSLMRDSTGIWKVEEASSLFVGIYRPS